MSAAISSAIASRPRNTSVHILHVFPIIAALSILPTPSYGKFRDKTPSPPDCLYLGEVPNTRLNSTESTAPYCVGYSFSEWNASLYECAATPASSAELMQTTFAGQTDPRIWVPIFSSIGTSTPAATSLLLTGPTAQPTATSISSGQPVPGYFPALLTVLFAAALSLL
jgi:hypothetical protein